MVGPESTTEVKPSQFAAVDALLRAAFPTGEEADLVRALRADRDMLSEQCMCSDGETIGYYALSRMQAPEGWACLAPVAVRPDWQSGAQAERDPDLIDGAPDEEKPRKPWRVGSRMMRALVQAFETGSLGESGFDAIVVLGKPSFYARAGFSLERAQKLRSRYSVSHTLILGQGDDVPEVELIYPAAFSELD